MLTTKLEYEIEESKDGYSVLKLNRDDNKCIYVGSKYNMKREIDKFILNFNEYKNERDIFIIYGFGSGDHIKALRNIYSNKIIVFEPNRNLINYIKDLEWVKNDKNLKVISCEEKELIFLVKKQVNEFNFKNSEYIQFSNYNSIYKDESKLFFKILNEYIVELSLDLNTKLFFGRKWFENTIKMIPYIVNGIPADLYNGKYKNKPAIIVSAGPSLVKNVDLLKQVEENSLIISGGRTLKALIEKGIKIKLLAIADATDLNYKLVKDYIKDITAPILFSEGANINIVKEHKGLKLFYSYSKIIENIVGRKLTHISTAGSVAHAMTSYAANLGSNPIIFIGQDFAYVGDEHYSKLTKDEYSTEDKNKKFIFVEDINGNKVRTDYALNNQRLGMEKIIELYKNVTFINSTEGGARIKGTIEMPLKEAINKYKSEKVNDFEKINYNDNMKKNALRELEHINYEGKKIKELISEILKNKNLSMNFNYIKNICIENQLFENLLFPVVYEFYRTDRNIKDSGLELNDKTDVNKNFYLKIINELEYAIDIIEQEKSMI